MSFCTLPSTSNPWMNSYSWYRFSEIGTLISKAPMSSSKMSWAFNSRALAVAKSLASTAWIPSWVEIHASFSSIGIHLAGLTVSTCARWYAL